MTRLLLLCGLLFLVAAPPTLAQTTSAYVVERGDTLYNIAQRFETTVFDLRQVNGLLDNRIQVGQTLRIPGTTPPSSAVPPSSPLASAPPVPAVVDDTGALVHTVRPGETLYRLSVWFDTSVDELMGWNGLTDTQLSVGQRVVVRQAAQVAASSPAPEEVVPSPSEPTESAVPPTDAVQDEERAGADVAATLPVDADEPEETRATVPPPVPGGVLPGGLSSADLADDPNAEEPDVEAPEESVPSNDAASTTASVPPTAPLPAPRSLQPAEVVQLTVAPPPFVMTDTTVPADEVHLVRRGETLYAIASRYQIGAQALVSANPGLTTAPLVAGQLLFLPEEVGTMQYHRTVQASLPPPTETGQVLVYPDGLAGRAMASGVAYDPDALVGSHRDLPFGSVVLVTNPALQRSVFVRIADRGPVSGQFVMELSRRAAEALGLDPAQAASVDIRMVP
ncbi:MAG: LysM peptidoglycan-binding domain-containing protein [Bacteroidota bacterium]